VLIVVDQFEELYTSTSDEEARRRFLDELLAASSRVGSKANIALTLRGDFVAKALAYRPLCDRLQDAQINLGPMTPELTRLKEQETRDIASEKIPDPYARINRYLELHSLPEGALVEINGLTQGHTPLKVNVQVSPGGWLWDNQDITFIPLEGGQYQQYRRLQGAAKPWDLYGIEPAQSKIPEGASITVSMYLHSVSN
jgi:hypothetical protein